LLYYHRRCVFVRYWPQNPKSYYYSIIQSIYTLYRSSLTHHIVYRGICPCVRVLYDILTWERRFDEWSSSGRYSIRRRTLSDTRASINLTKPNETPRSSALSSWPATIPIQIDCTYNILYRSVFAIKMCKYINNNYSYFIVGNKEIQFAV